MLCFFYCYVLRNFELIYSHSLKKKVNIDIIQRNEYDSICVIQGWEKVRTRTFFNMKNKS